MYKSCQKSVKREFFFILKDKKVNLILESKTKIPKFKEKNHRQNQNKR